MSNIKKRLKDAYDNVTFYANKTWTSDNYLYQKANQDLYARHMKIEESFAEEVTRAKTVQDCIPQSKLAQYANYEYDESRELSYTPSGSEVLFHYPCQQKEESIEEPWMLPEVEQLFIWLTYSPDFNLLRYKDLVDFDQSDDHTKVTCTLKDFHEVDPRFFDSFETTPGKSRFTSTDRISDVDLQQFLPPLLNLHTFEDMTVKMKIDLDTIKNIWKTSRADDAALPKEVQVFKSAFDNLFVNENSKSVQYLQCSDRLTSGNDQYHFNELQERANDFRNLQNLAELLKKSKKTTPIRDSNAHEFCATNSKSETNAATETTTPTRRLYSDVVQGFVSNKSSSSKVDAGSPTLDQSRSCDGLQFRVDSPDEACCNQATEQSYESTSEVESRPATPPVSWFEQVEVKHEFKKPDENNYNCPQANFVTIPSAEYQNIAHATPTNALSGGNNYQNYFGGNITACEYHPNEIYGSYTNNTFQNPNLKNVYSGSYRAINPFQYSQNNMYCNRFSGANFPSNLYSGPSNPYAYNLPNSFPQQKQNPINFNNSGQPWIMHHYRTPTVYNVAHFPVQPYFLLPPQPPKQQRWMQSPQYLRPHAPQPHHVNMTRQHTFPQSWAAQNQNLYKANSTQVCAPLSQNQTFENSTSINNLNSRQKFNKNRTTNSQHDFACAKSLESLCSSDQGDKSISDSNSKMSHATRPAKKCGEASIAMAKSGNSIDLKYVMKKETEQKNSNISTAVSKNFECHLKSLPVTASTSEELERQALDEYRSSDESVYKELERQAEEQYEDSENSFSPPSNELYFGGLACLCEFLNSCLPGLLLISLEIYDYQVHIRCN